MSVRANGEGSIYARKDGRLVGQYRVDGKIKYVYGKNRTEVKEKLEKALDKVKSKIDFNNEKKTLNQWLEEWLDSYAKNGIKLSTYISYKGIIRGHILEHRIGRMELGNLNTHTFQKYFNDIAT